MKKVLLALALALLAGCASTQKSSYRETTPEAILAQFNRNDEGKDYSWNEWRYAGSDDKYDYFYQYDGGIVLPPLGFEYYKVQRGTAYFRGVRYPFHPDLRNNRDLN